jgi:hypothetical protein
MHQIGVTIAAKEYLNEVRPKQNILKRL